MRLYIPLPRAKCPDNSADSAAPERGDLGSWRLAGAVPSFLKGPTKQRRIGRGVGKEGKRSLVLQKLS